jgi:hypothetical protein
MPLRGAITPGGIEFQQYERGIHMKIAEHESREKPPGRMVHILGDGRAGRRKIQPGVRRSTSGGGAGRLGWHR